MGALSFTWDEGGDLTTVECLKHSGDPFACTEDISQTRLPFYLHAIFGSIASGTRPHFLLSFFFSAMTLIAVYAYAHRHCGPATALLFAMLYVTSPQLLASGRMVLTHSHIICTAFSTLSFLAFFEYQRTRRTRWLVACAIGSGAAAASSVLAVFNGVMLLAFYKRPAWRDLLFFPIAAITFFATSIIYIRPSLFTALVAACRLGFIYPFWNYLGLGTSRAPWFFPFVLLAVKVGPWLIAVAIAAVTRVEGAMRIALGLLAILILKGAMFGYETPHHQVQFYPLLYLFIAAGIARVWSKTVAIAFVALLTFQLFDVVRFFPNYLFYGGQYGQRLIGEFYGPAVIHAQGRESVQRIIDSLPEATFLMADNNIFERSGRRFVPFTHRDPNVVYRYALVDRLYATHFEFPERDAYNQFLAAHCQPYFTSYFPPHEWAYRVMRCHPAGTAGRGGRSADVHTAAP
jgi:hypothetical protein